MVKDCLSYAVMKVGSIINRSLGKSILTILANVLLNFPGRLQCGLSCRKDVS